MLTHSDRAKKNRNNLGQGTSAMMPAAPIPAHVQMPRYLGNSYLQQRALSVSAVPVIQRKCACGGTPDASGECAECRRKRLAAQNHQIQTKLSIGPSDDVYEREADQVADRIMRMSIDPPQQQSGENVVAPCIQRVASGNSQSGGRPLSTATRSFMEPRFGTDFSDVRLHTDSQAQRTESQINAHAFTYGHHVWLGPGASEGDRQLMAHELTHVIQQSGKKARVQMQPAPAAAPPAAAGPPAFRDCTPGITGDADANQKLENARQRAQEFIGAARRVLGSAPAPGTTYDTALNRHFISPNAAQRATIAANYGQIMQAMRVGNFICNSDNICGTEQAFWIPQDDLIHVCRPFWALDRTCGAIVLIHEGGHDIGVDAAIAGHPPNRGDAAYPAGNVAPPAGQTTAARMQNPDAYAFFAAHIWRDTDTSRTCF